MDKTDKVGYRSDEWGEKEVQFEMPTGLFILEIVFCTGMQVGGLENIRAPH